MAECTPPRGSNSPIKKLVHKGIERSLVGNEKVEKKINGHIDKMFECRAAKYCIQKSRVKITGQSCISRKHFESKIQTLIKEGGVVHGRLLADCRTNYGNVTVHAVRNMCATSKPMVNEALAMIGEEYDIEFDVGEVCAKLQVDTDVMMLDKSVSEEVDQLNLKLKTILEECELLSGQESGDVKILKQCASIKVFHKSLVDKSNECNFHSSAMRSIFEKASTTGSFPRHYSYRGIILYWEDICNKETDYQKVVRHLQNQDCEEGTTLYEEFESKMNQLRVAQNKYTIQVCLDGHDYEEEQVS